MKELCVLSVAKHEYKYLHIYFRQKRYKIDEKSPLCIHIYISNMPPPKKAAAVWAKPQLSATPEFAALGPGSNGATSRKQQLDNAVSTLRNFIKKTITDQNLLNLEAGEILSTANLLITTKDKDEVLNWCKTLMQPESFADEIIRYREEIAERFKDVNESGEKSQKNTSAKSGGANAQGPNRRSRGKNVATGNNLCADEAGGLVEGVLFECGCFGTIHKVRLNCMNCGRIVCMQESSDVCYACGLDPSICIDYELKVANGVIDEAAADANKKKYDDAINQRDKFLQYARERTKRTTVIDDQSGVFGFQGAFVSAQERVELAAKDVEERKRIQDMHKKSGAFQVHLDIVGQNAALGATQLFEKGEEATNVSTSSVPEAKITTADIGFGDSKSTGDDSHTSDGFTQRSSFVPEVPKSIAQLRNHHASQGTTSIHHHIQSEKDDASGCSAEVSDEEQEGIELSAQGGDGRIVALPSLMQKIFYGDGSETVAASAVTRRVKRAADEEDGVAAEKSKPKGGALKSLPTWDDVKAAGNAKADIKISREVVSRRVQIDYYEEDAVTWQIEKSRREQEEKQRRLGKSDGRAFHMSPDHDNEYEDDDTSSADERESARAALRRPPTRHDPVAPLRETHAVSITNSANAAGDAAKDAPDAQDEAEMEEDLEEAHLREAQKLSCRPSSDEGICITMHQPWASLLVAGIKKSEGRNWDPTTSAGPGVPNGSFRRGRLWIHAASARPMPSQIEELERVYYPYLEPGQKFPSSYPTSCLLGYVMVTDVLDEAALCARHTRIYEYHQRNRAKPRSAMQMTSTGMNPKPAECSAFNFLCALPKMLPFFLSMDGKHKMYKLDRKLWQAARKQIGET